MNTNYDDEATRYPAEENEETRFEETSTIEQTTEDAKPTDEVQAKPAKGIWKRAAVGAGSGLLIGGVTTMLMGMKKADSNDNGSDNHKDELSNPEWVDDQIQVATTVTDDMSFGEAFAAARAEVGPGGCFEWHGQVYGTYTADEWNGMTAEQRAEYSDHFSWNHIDHSASDVAQHSNNNAGSQQPSSGNDNASVANDDDIEVVSVNHSENRNDLTQSTSQQPQENQVEVLAAAQSEPEIEIIGVEHDSNTGANIGGMIVDGQEVILIDVDGNMEFDYIASDVNGNGQIDQDELADIQGQGLSVNDLGGLSNPAGDMLASNDGPDYSADLAYEG